MSQPSPELQRLLDRAAIQDLHARYFQAIDSVELDKVRSCFTDDIRADYDGRKFVEGIEALMDSFFVFKKKASGEWKNTTHFMGNLSFNLLRDDIAETEIYAFAFIVTPSPTGDQVAMRSLRYLDRIRKTKGGWRICDRVHTLDWSCAVPTTFANATTKRITATIPERSR